MFQKNRSKTVGGVPYTRYLLLEGDRTTDGWNDGMLKTVSPRFFFFLKKGGGQKGDKAMIRTQEYIKLNTRAKEIQQVNPDGPDNSNSIRPQSSHL